MESSKAGASKALSATWPVIVGIVIVCVIVAIIAIAMYKTGAFKKLRFFNQKLEEDKEVIEEQKRASMMEPSAT